MQPNKLSFYSIVQDTINRIIPEEVSYIYKYDEFKRFIDDQFEMPERLVSALVRFLEQNNGTLSQRAKTKEFSLLSEEEVREIEKTYHNIFEIN
jgi:hypothetical protein